MWRERGANKNWMLVKQIFTVDVNVDTTLMSSGPIGGNMFLINMYTRLEFLGCTFQIPWSIDIKWYFEPPENELIPFQFFASIVWSSEVHKAGLEDPVLDPTWFNMVQGCDWEIRFCACLLYLSDSLKVSLFFFFFDFENCFYSVG